ncbi:hypothetical protein KDW_49710 [Dictyobacter vulcani]|uniref:PPM-type phosphatase domain-containing protein n=1 Tax=Dictyobacter vulcani TaxID=2607529 RepID=A0A5J4KXF9_9CHLR|nr:protein phosphatase 2C domain-containing protein [Dictyobacter vulcani]GER90809.1 hypothetical protein KDW_49710 [Dictyobacter vulcani]
MMSENIKEAYRQQGWIKMVSLVAVVLGALLLLASSGGFPPWAWRFLVQVLQQLPTLWKAQGAAILLPLLGLCLLSLSLLILWIAIGVLGFKIGTHILADFKVPPSSFEDDLREAELLAEQALQEQDFAEDDLTEPVPLRPVPAARSQQSQSYSQPGVRRSRPSRPIQEPQTQAVPVPAMRSSAYAPAAQAVGDIGFPGLSYPTPIYRQPGNSRGSATGNRQTTNLRQPSYPNTQDRFDEPLEYDDAQSRPSQKSLRVVPPTALRERPDTSEDVNVEAAFAEMVEREERQQAEQAKQRQFERQQAEREQAEQAKQRQFEQQQAEYARQQQLDQPQFESPEDESLDVDLWETRPGDLEEDDLDLEQYDPLDDLDDTIPASERAARMQAALLAPDAEEFDFDQQHLPPVKKSRPAPVPEVSEIEPAPRFVVGIGLDPGLTRKDSPNEDSLFTIQGMRVTDEGSKPAGLFMVADGMGGHANGREASRTAIHAISDVIVPALLRDVSGSSAKEEKTLFQDMLKDGVHQANLALYRRNRERTRMMGTTLTAALVVDRMAYIVNVGDSRTYLYRASEGLTQITHDHSVVARLVEDGVITRDEVYTHPQRNQIYRCLGEHASVEIDSFAIPLQVNDILLLCSDGLWEMVRDSALEKIMASSAHNPSQMSAMLVQAALNHGGADNISVIAVGLTSGEDAVNWML